MGLAHLLQMMAVCAAPHLFRAMNEVGIHGLFLVDMHSEKRMCWVFLPLVHLKPLLSSQNMGSQIKFAFIVLYFVAERYIFFKVIKNPGKNVK